MLDIATKDLHKSRDRVRGVLLRDGHDLVRRLERASVLGETGGCPGMYEFISTGQLLPILIGTDMIDPSGSGLSVPILAADRVRDSGAVIPLGGSVEDPQGDGLMPIMLGEKVVDPITEKSSYCVGIKYNQDSEMAEPITAISVKNKKKRKPAFAAVSNIEWIYLRNYAKTYYMY